MDNRYGLGPEDLLFWFVIIVGTLIIVVWS